MKKIIFLLLLIPSLLFGQSEQIVSTGYGITWLNSHAVTINIDTIKLNSIVRIFNMTQEKVLYDISNPNRYYNVNYLHNNINSIPGLYVDTTNNRIYFPPNSPSIVSSDIIFVYVKSNAKISIDSLPGSSTSANQEIEINYLHDIDSVQVINRGYLETIRDGTNYIGSVVNSSYIRPLLSNVSNTSFSNATLAGLMTDEATYITSNPTRSIICRTMIFNTTALTYDSVITTSGF